MRILGGLLLLGLVGYGLTGVVQVRPGELAVVRRFGRVLPEPAGPGLSVFLPWGMDRIDRVAVDRLQSVTVGFRPGEDDSAAAPPGQLLTGDHNLVNVQAVVYYKVRPAEVADYVVQADRVDDLVARSAEAVMAEWVAGQPVDAVLLHGKTDLRDPLRERTQRRLERYRLGLEVLDARVVVLEPPREVKFAFDDVAQAQTGNETLHNQAEQEREASRREALAEAHRILREAETYSYQQRRLAEKEAERFALRLAQARVARRHNPHYERLLWEEYRADLLRRLGERKALGVLPEGDLHLFTPAPEKK